MHTPRHDGSAHQRSIALRLSERSVTPRVLEALCALGYVLVDADSGDDCSRARVWLVDEERLDTLPQDADDDLRVLAIVSSDHEESIDSRVFARTTRPGRLGTVYEMIQSALERTPRRTPRIPTRLSARCIRAERRSIGAVLSLSEGGCLLRTGEALRKGAKLDLQFALPDYGLVSTRAECRYVRSGDAGLAFDAPHDDVRHTIAHFVTCQLARDGLHASVG